MLSRRTLMLAAGAGFASARYLRHPAFADSPVTALEMIEPLGKPSVVWTAYDLLQPVLQETMERPVTTRTVPGHDGLDALHAALEPSQNPVRLFGGPIMATQYAERMPGYDVKLENLTPVAKLSNGFSVALFAPKGAGIASWDDVVAAAKKAPLTVSCLQKATAAYIAKLMLERKAGLAMDVTLHDTLVEVLDDVTSGRTAAGILPTALVAQKRDTFVGLVTFGAQRNAVLADTPTYAEISGNRKLAFTESIGVLGTPNLDDATAAALGDVFLVAGQDPRILQSQEASIFPVVVNGADVLSLTMDRNNRVLDSLLS